MTDGCGPMRLFQARWMCRMSKERMPSRKDSKSGLRRTPDCDEARTIPENQLPTINEAETRSDRAAS